jgi:hypothetical protein
MWIIYEFTEITNPEYDIPYSTTHLYPKAFMEYQDLAQEISEICNKHKTKLITTTAKQLIISVWEYQP